jgi:hypothetical protein
MHLFKATKDSQNTHNVNGGGVGTGIRKIVKVSSPTVNEKVKLEE